MPPMVPMSGVPSNADVLTGSNANCWFFEFDQRLHVGEWRAGLHRDDQFVRFIGSDRVQPGEIEQRIGRHRLADQALGAMTDDFQRLVAGHRSAHRLFDVGGVPYFWGVHRNL